MEGIKVNLGRKVTVRELVSLARGLAEEYGLEGGNPEYDRALTELIVDAAGLPMEGGREAVAELLRP